MIWNICPYNLHGRNDIKQVFDKIKGYNHQYTLVNFDFQIILQAEIGQLLNNG
jgi:hypothetical protein